jgi:hypothetical protein
MGMHEELVGEPQGSPQFPHDLEDWWRKIVLDGFRLLDDELVARAESGMLVGSSGIFMMALEKYLTLANCGTT